MTPNQRKALITERLQKAFSPSQLIVTDESAFHIGHQGALSGASHFALIIATSQFANLSLIQRHRLIYEQLKDLIPNEIHALKIKALLPNQ
jgi:BolA family transcriptional regulator, general stress-responsive regulator